MTKALSGEMLDELLSWPEDLLVLRGAEEDDEDDESETDEDDESEEDDEDDESDESDEDGEDGKSKGKKGDPDPKDRKISNLEEAVARNVTKRKAAQTEVTKLTARIHELEKDGVKDEETRAHYDEVERTNSELTNANNELRLQVSFLQDSTHAWVDPAAALKLVDLSNVEIDEKDGSVEGLVEALEALAKAKPYLLKTVKKPKQDDDTKRAPRTGTPAGGSTRGKSTQVKAREAALKDKYSGLRR